MTRTYLVECYWPGVTEHAYADSVARAGRAVHALQGGGRDVRFVDSLLILEDESVFYRVAGESVAEIEQVCAQAALPFARIIEYIDAADSTTSHAMNSSDLKSPPPT